MPRYINADLTEAHGEWLNTFAWNWLVTGTFRYPVSSIACSRAVRQYMEALRAVAAAPYCAWMSERHRDGRLHAHLLVGGVNMVSHRCHRLAAACIGCGTHCWRHGLADVRVYDPTQAGVFYLLKTLRWGAELEIEGTPLPAVDCTPAL